MSACLLAKDCAKEESFIWLHELSGQIVVRHESIQGKEEFCLLYNCKSRQNRIEDLNKVLKVLENKLKLNGEKSKVKINHWSVLEGVVTTTNTTKKIQLDKKGKEFYNSDFKFVRCEKRRGCRSFINIKVVKWILPVYLLFSLTGVDKRGEGFSREGGGFKDLSSYLIALGLCDPFYYTSTGLSP